MPEVDKLHRFLACLIDAVMLTLIMVMWTLYLHIPQPSDNLGPRIYGLWLMFKGVCQIITGALQMFSIGNPVLLIMNLLSKDITNVINSFILWQYLTYYFVFESLFKATPGKMILGIEVVSTKNRQITTWHILLRTMCRFLPFEVFSCIPHGKSFWHDRLSETQVVYKNKTIPVVNSDLQGEAGNTKQQ